MNEPELYCETCGRPLKDDLSPCTNCRTHNSAQLRPTVGLSIPSAQGEPSDYPTIEHISGQTPITDSSAVGFQGSKFSAPQLSFPADFGDYELLAEIARGGMGVIYRARHKQLNRLAAIKMILGGRFSSSDAHQRFRMEAEAAAKLDHPGIVPIYDVGSMDGQPFFAMKLVEGGSLAQRLPEFRQDDRRAAQLISQVAQAVHHAHQRGVLHRDIKPANILIDQQDHPMLTDLGLAKNAGGDSDLTQSNAILGTPHYMPPEQAQPGQPVTVAGDIYSLGAILYELLTGKPPHGGESGVAVMMSVINQPITPPSKVAATVDRDLELICLKCLEKSPEQRYPTAAHLADDLSRWLRSESISITPPSTIERVRRWMKQNRKIGFAVLALLAAFTFAVPVLLSVLVAMDNPAALYEGSTRDPRPWIFSLSNLPRWVPLASSLLFLLLWPTLGAMVPIVSRPENWKQNFLNGVGLAALCAGLLVLTLGWAPFSLIANISSNTTLERFADHALGSASSPGATPANTDSIRQSLIEDFPLMEHYPDSEKADYLQKRMLADGLSAGATLIPVFMVAAISLALPIVVGSVIMFSLLSRQLRWWILWPRYFLAWGFGAFSVICTIGAVFGGRFNGKSFWQLGLVEQLLIGFGPPLITYLMLRRWRGHRTRERSAVDAP